MTDSEYKKGLKRLSEFFPTFDPPAVSTNVWFSVLEKLSAELFYQCLTNIMLNKTSWYQGFNLVALVKEYEGASQKQLWQKMNANTVTEDHQLESRFDPKRREENKKAIRKLIKGLGSLMSKEKEAGR